MLAQLSTWLMAAAVTQAPADPAWLKAVPGDVDVAVRVPGAVQGRDDLMAMLKAMSPALADHAGPMLSGHVDELQNSYGDLAKTPWVGIGRVASPGPDGALPMAFLIQKDDQKAVLRALSGGNDPATKPAEGGLVSFDGPQNSGTWYAAKGAGVVVVGPDRALVASAAKPSGKALDAALSPAAKKAFLGGDLGLYVNAAALTARYADQIEQARQGFVAALDQAGQQQGNAAAMDFAKAFYGGLFDRLKDADALALGVDFAASGLHLTAALNAKPGTNTATAAAEGQPVPTAGLGRFAPGATFYTAMSLGARTFKSLQRMSLRMLAPGGKMTPAQEKAAAELDELGRIEAEGSVNLDKGMAGLNVVKVSEPRRYIQVSSDFFKAMGGGDAALKVYKEVTVTADEATHRGYRFTHILAKIDPDQLAKLGGGNPGSTGAMKAMFPGDALNSWMGTDGRQVLQVMAPTWDEARKRVDAYLDGRRGVGETPGFKAVRSGLPERATLLMLVHVQGLARLMAAQLSATLNKPDLKAPTDMPEEPAFLGFALTPAPPTGYEFHLVVPSAVGPAVEKGLVPVFHGLQGAARP